MIPQVLAALWLLGLYAAAPMLRQSARYDFPDRLRDSLILGIAIAGGLGAVNLLYPAACFGALLLCLAIADIRRREPRFVGTTLLPDPPYVLVAALLLVAWPQLMRPLLDGDSLSYHLPNAASWVQAHSIWTTATRYWWYPPASELFAAALYAAGGPFALPWSGLCALALLGFRIVTWARELGVAPLYADALAAATVTCFPLAIQGGTLQNDVWLAAFFLETLWTLRANAGEGAARTAAIAALVKPQGWLLTLVALVAGRARFGVFCAAGAALTAWIARDALLAKSAMISPAASASYAHPYASTILAHGLPALLLLATVAGRVSPFLLLGLCAAIVGPLIAPNRRRLGWAALAAVAIFLALPFGYETSVAQLATGASLRFAAPAVVLGALLLGIFLRKWTLLGTTLLLASTVFGVWSLLSIFWNDGSTHVALLAAAVGAALTAATGRAAALRRLRPLAIGLAVVFTMHYAGRHAIDYYDDALRVGATTPGVYRWIATTRPQRIGGEGLRLGVVNVLSPATFTRDLPDDRPCDRARSLRVVLVAVAQSDLPPQTNAQRLAAARACGSVLYSDPSGVVAAP
ncbi:MAG TPA: hypothetical protein VHX17_11820 [Candidatus Cybelea sp.]|nr:hypothetical protein [Candidatus Cybelea sp.]